MGLLFEGNDPQNCNVFFLSFHSYSFFFLPRASNPASIFFPPGSVLDWLRDTWPRSLGRIHPFIKPPRLPTVFYFVFASFTVHRSFVSYLFCPASFYCSGRFTFSSSHVFYSIHSLMVYEIWKIIVSRKSFEKKKTQTKYPLPSFLAAATIWRFSSSRRDAGCKKSRRFIEYTVASVV